MPPELERSLRWWEDVLQRGLCERRQWKQEQRQPVNLFCDASGFPAYLGAVVMVDDKCYYTHLAPSSELMSMFRRRRDNQIMGLELLSISLGLCTFEIGLKFGLVALGYQVSALSASSSKFW